MSVDVRLKAIAPYLLVGAGAGYLYRVASQFEFQRRGDTLGPDFWPKAILVLVIAVCLYEIARALLFRARHEVGGVLEELVEESVQERGGSDEEAAPSAFVPLIAGMALTALYVWLLPLLGFFSATVPFLAAFIALGGYRRWGVLAAVSVAGTVLLFFIFVKVVYVSLPIGQGPFRQVTLALMRLLGVR